MVVVGQCLQTEASEFLPCSQIAILFPFPSLPSSLPEEAFFILVQGLEPLVKAHNISFRDWVQEERRGLMISQESAMSSGYNDLETNAFKKRKKPDAINIPLNLKANCLKLGEQA